jgi:aryl carrier-like protein
MFKIHGQRVEPGEVENVAQQYEGVGDCICCKKEVNGDETVCLFFEADETIDTDKLHSFMSKQLTHYMVPAIIMQLEKLPRNARGKLDRKAIPDPQVENSMMMIPPATDREKLLFDIVVRHLDTDQFGVTDNLLHLGLNSIRAMKIVAEACRKGLMLKATDLMKNPSIRQVLQVNMQMAYWWNAYDESKPIMVFAHGIALTSNMKGRLDLLSRQFSVFTIENIEEHFHYIFEDENYDEVIMPFVNEYSVERKLPDRRKRLSRKPKANADIDYAVKRESGKSVKNEAKPQENAAPVTMHKLRHERFFDEEGEPLSRHDPEKSRRKRPQMVPLSRRKEKISEDKTPEDENE